MGPSTMANAAKNRPNLRGFHHATIKRNLCVVFVLCITSVTITYFGRNLPRKRRVAEFYLNYDAEAAAERMRAAGVFQSTPADSPEPEQTK